MTDTAQRLLDAVDTVIAEHGPAGVTLRRVGEVIGVSHTAAAHYYKNKPGLLTAYITRAYERVADGIESASAIGEDRDALLAVGTGYAQFALENPSAFAVMSRLELANVDEPTLWAARERGFFALASLIERAQQNGWAGQRDALDVLAITWSLVHGFTQLWVDGPLWAPYDGNELVPTLRRVLGDTLDSLA